MDSTFKGGIEGRDGGEFEIPRFTKLGLGKRKERRK